MNRPKPNVAAAPCQCRRTPAGELKIGIVEEGIGMQPSRLVWLSRFEVIARFGIDGGKALVERAQQSHEDT